eukprot:352817-Chlamydomonas_euryale.AAC.11
MAAPPRRSSTTGTAEAATAAACRAPQAGCRPPRVRCNDSGRAQTASVSLTQRGRQAQARSPARPAGG